MAPPPSPPGEVSAAGFLGRDLADCPGRSSSDEDGFLAVSPPPHGHREGYMPMKGHSNLHWLRQMSAIMHGLQSDALVHAPDTLDNQCLFSVLRYVGLPASSHP